MGREEGGRFRMGNTCISVVDSRWHKAKPIKYCKVKKLKKKKKRFSSVTDACLTLCDPMDCNMSGFPVHHQLLELTQAHVYLLGHAIQPSYLLSSPLLLPSIFPSIRVFSNELFLCLRWPKYWSFSFSISRSNEYSGLRMRYLHVWEGC